MASLKVIRDFSVKNVAEGAEEMKQKNSRLLYHRTSRKHGSHKHHQSMMGDVCQMRRCILTRRDGSIFEA